MTSIQAFNKLQKLLQLGIPAKEQEVRPIDNTAYIPASRVMSIRLIRDKSKPLAQYEADEESEIKVPFGNEPFNPTTRTVITRGYLTDILNAIPIDEPVQMYINHNGMLKIVSHCEDVKIIARIVPRKDMENMDDPDLGKASELE